MPEKAGYLHREAQSGLKTIRKRWCVLSKEHVSLFFTQKQGHQRALGAVDLSDATVGPFEHKKRNFCFRIVDRNHQAHFYFTQNEADRDAWIKLIRRVIQGAGFQVLSADEEELARKRLEDKARKQLPTGKNAEEYKAMMRAKYEAQLKEHEQLVKSGKLAAVTGTSASLAGNKAQSMPARTTSSKAEKPNNTSNRIKVRKRVEPSGDKAALVNAAGDEHDADAESAVSMDEDTKTSESAKVEPADAAASRRRRRKSDEARVTAAGGAADAATSAESHDDEAAAGEKSGSASKEKSEGKEKSGAKGKADVGGAAASTSGDDAKPSKTKANAGDKASEKPTTESIVSLLEKATSEAKAKRQLTQSQQAQTAAAASAASAKDVPEGVETEQIEIDGQVITLVKRSVEKVAVSPEQVGEPAPREHNPNTLAVPAATASTKLTSSGDEDGTRAEAEANVREEVKRIKRAAEARAMARRKARQARLEAEQLELQKQKQELDARVELAKKRATEPTNAAAATDENKDTTDNTSDNNNDDKPVVSELALTGEASTGVTQAGDEPDGFLSPRKVVKKVRVRKVRKGSETADTIADDAAEKSGSDEQDGNDDDEETKADVHDAHQAAVDAEEAANAADKAEQEASLAAKEAADAVAKAKDDKAKDEAQAAKDAADKAAKHAADAAARARKDKEEAATAALHAEQTAKAKASEANKSAAELEAAAKAAEEELAAAEADVDEELAKLTAEQQAVADQLASKEAELQALAEELAQTAAAAIDESEDTEEEDKAHTPRPASPVSNITTTTTTTVVAASIDVVATNDVADNTATENKPTTDDKVEDDQQEQQQEQQQ
eukprot:CAMPEP_0168588260 /NCGR_PEP_ID=MMETSP0420-20121227/5351_1 /TAXON_ID=498008 /ORGANISM="Pessonella sp." /LENGTH=842 /DNA_ID=CAMNT_0008623663 /DNA_START=5 /DNA_END=2530 /DNA_ORIENTATION=-